MSDGLITRVGKWLDRTWASKVTEAELQVVADQCSKRSMDRMSEISDIRIRLAELAAGTPDKELAELKTRMEKIELYTGITRKIDPTKPAVAKSAFSM